jgi:hypothetical protein
MTMRARTCLRVTTAVLPVVLMAGCTGSPAEPADSEATPTATFRSPPPSPEPTVSPTGGTPTPGGPAPASPAPGTTQPAEPEGPDSPVLRPGADTRPATGEATTREVALIRDVRVGAHRGFDRIVVEFEGEGTPEYRVEYVDRPIRESGSGNVVPVAGDAWLEIWMQPASGVDLSAGETFREVYTGPRRIRTPQLDVVEEVVRSGDFEAVTSWVAGVRTPQPFTVRALSGPPRLVVDVRAP